MHSDLTFTIGADPEMFVVDSEQRFKSIIGLIGANKWAPLELTKDGHAVLEDNVAVEFNIPACSSSEQFVKEIQLSMALIQEKIPHLSYSQESAISFPESELNCPEAWVFGCDPDLDAWKMRENPKPHADDPNLRSCGGHIHVGSALALANPVETIRAMDLFLGVPSTKLDTKGVLRRKLYGKPGAFRFKPKYGVEYRTLSNFWIFSSELIQWAYEGTQKALEFVHSGNSITTEMGEKIQACINNSDMNLYEELKEHYSL